MAPANGIDVLGMIEQLMTLDPLDELSAGAFFGVALEREDDPGNPYMRAFVGQAPDYSPFRNIELRLPGEGAEFSGPLLIVTTRPAGRVSADAWRERFGEPAAVEPPSASAPLNEPVFEVYEREEGRLSLGYLADDAASLLDTFVIDRG